MLYYLRRKKSCIDGHIDVLNELFVRDHTGEYADSKNKVLVCTYLACTKPREIAT